MRELNGKMRPWMAALEESIVAFVIVFFMTMGAAGFAWPPAAEILWASFGTGFVWGAKTWAEARALQHVKTGEGK